jgi:hypothetical protein
LGVSLTGSLVPASPTAFMTWITTAWLGGSLLFYNQQERLMWVIRGASHGAGTGVSQVESVAEMLLSPCGFST